MSTETTTRKRRGRPPTTPEGKARAAAREAEESATTVAAKADVPATPVAETPDDPPPRKVARRRRTAKADPKGAEAMLGMMLGALYAAPSIMLPKPAGDHWPLDEVERQALAEAVSAALDSLPSARAKAFKKLLATYAPLATLGVTMMAITAPRVMHTRHVLEEMRRANAQAQSSGGNVIPVTREGPRNIAPAATVPEGDA